jgi:hypothetical protein
MQTYTVSVTHTNRERTASGGYREFVAIVSVLAANAGEARCVAAQMVASLRCEHEGMVLGASVI